MVKGYKSLKPRNRQTGANMQNAQSETDRLKIRLNDLNNQIRKIKRLQNDKA